MLTIIYSIFDYSTFIGGSNSYNGKDIILDTNGNAYIAGNEYYSEDIFIVKFSFEDVGNVLEIIPTSFRVSAPYPNPFNPSVTLEYEIPADCFVKLVIYDVLGREVTVLKNGYVTAGAHRAVWNGRDSKGDLVAGGVYLYKFEADNHVVNGKVLFLK